MTQRLDALFEKVVIEARMLWQFVVGNVLFMGLPTLLWFRATENRREGTLLGDASIFIISAVIGLLWAVMSWALMRFRFPYASSRFINFTRIAFPWILTESVALVFCVTLTRQPIYNSLFPKEVLVIGIVVLTGFLSVLSRDTIFKTTENILALLESA